MASDDLPLNRPTPRLTPEPPPRRSSPLQWILVGVAGVAAGGLLTYWWMSRSQPGTAPPPTTVVTDENAASNRPKRQPIDLPSLDASDLLLRSLVSALSSHPTLARLVATPQIVRGATLAVVQIGEGRTPHQPLSAIRPETRVDIAEATSGPIDARTYERWGPIAAGLTSVDPADAAQLYVNVKPLVDEAYIELGYSDGDFDAAIVRAIELLRRTPIPARPPTLVRRPGGLFEYADPALQNLQPAQKQFLLMGPTHQRQILAWLDELAHSLDLDLPPPQQP